jgi:hypothetical protein
MENINLYKYLVNSKSFLGCFIILTCLFSCKKDDAELARMSELGSVVPEYTVSAEAGTVDVKVLSNEKFKVSIPDSIKWMSVSAETFQGDASFSVRYDQNTGFPRKGFISMYAAESGRYDTVVVKQQGVSQPELVFPKLNTTVLGGGGKVSNTLQTNIPFKDIKVQVIYPTDQSETWVNTDFDYNKEQSVFSFTVKPNPSADNLRSVQVKLSFTDGWGVTHVSTLYLLQANANDLFGTEANFSEIRVWAGEKITKDLFIEGYVISDAGNKNMGDNSQTTPTLIDYTKNERTAYIQSVDGRYGFRIETSTANDNIFKRYNKVQLLLKGSGVEMNSNPNTYTITGVTSSQIMSQEQGSRSNLPVKEKYMSELTDDDIYTFVTLKDTEFPIRKGSFTPVNEGYTPLFNANRISKYPLLMRDKMGTSMFLFTNLNTPYRRDGSMLPYGSGTVSGILVNEKFTRFEYQDATNEDDYGNIGRYQLRHVSEDDIKLAANIENSFSALLTEYQYPNITSGVAYPTTGTNGRISVSAPINIAATSDYSYLGPVGAGYLGNNNQYGNGVLVGGSKQNTSASTNTDGKGGTAVSGLNGVCTWWNYEKNRGEAWIIEVSTQGINTDQLSLQFTALNWAAAGVGSPRYWKVEWSEHGNMEGNWDKITNYTVPDAPNFSNTLLHQLPGYKNINVALPLTMLGKSKVFIRLIVDRNLSSNGNTYASEPIDRSLGSALGYVAIRYNK